MSEKITLCCATQNRLSKLKSLVPKTIDYVDAMVFVDAFSVDGTREWLESYSPKIKVVQRKWDDSFANQYNRFVQEINDGWLLILDDDEFPSEGMLKALSKIIDDSDHGRIYDMVEFHCNPIEIDKTGKIISDNGPVNYYRFLLHRYNPGMRYVIDLHQNLIGHKRQRATRREETYYHIKSDEDSHRNACRNWFIAGVWMSGASTGIKPPEWYEFNELVRRLYPHVNVFNDLNDILVKGNVHPELKEYLRKVKDLKDEQPERLFNELRAYHRYYFEFLHPEEA